MASDTAGEDCIACFDRSTVDTSKIREWRSILTLVLFVVANVIVLFPFHIPIPVPWPVWHAHLDLLSGLRIIPHRRQHGGHDLPTRWKWLRFPMNFITGPLIADLFLLAILAIGREEVKGGTIGAENISPLDIMLFFITLAYIAISIDASGLIRYLAFKVLQWGGKNGNRLFFYLYTFFFVIGSFIGNDPIVLSGTAFLAYMTRVSENIQHPRAWIHSQFAVANIASAILVSSNPTNLVLAGAFNIKFINYTANMIVPVAVTAIVTFPLLLYIVFSSNELIPPVITMHDLPAEAKDKQPVNPNIPFARGVDEKREDQNIEEGNKLPLEEILNPFFDKGGAAFGALVMAATLITVLAVNAASTGTHPTPVFYITLPAAVVMLCWDLAFGWIHREKTREIARRGQEEIQRAEQEDRAASEDAAGDGVLATTQDPGADESAVAGTEIENVPETATPKGTAQPPRERGEKQHDVDVKKELLSRTPEGRSDETRQRHRGERATLQSLSRETYRWAQVTFPTVTAVLTHLPWALVPFAFSMFVLVQGLVTNGWIPVFAYGWDHWVEKTGTVGAVGGMGFLSVILCNFAGTNIGATILLSRVIQSWENIHKASDTPITNRTFWAAVYGMAIGVNYGAFSAAFSASLAGLLWRDILYRKHIRVKRLEFARVNLPIIAIAMSVGCAVLVAQVYIVRDTQPWIPGPWREPNQ